MIQSIIHDIGKASLHEYAPPDHSIGERAWPGADTRVLRQLTLDELARARRAPSPPRELPPATELPERVRARRRLDLECAISNV